MYSGGYTGKVLRVDLTAKTFSEEPLPEQVARDFIGGAGFTVKYLFDEVPADCDPLGPENKLIYACGPVHRHARSPAPAAWRSTPSRRRTGAMGVAMTGGHFPGRAQARRLRRADHRGPRRASRPTCGSRTGRSAFATPPTCGASRPPTASRSSRTSCKTRTSASRASARPARSSPTWPASSTSAASPAARAWAP